MGNITFICRFCGQERKNGNSLRNHERLCKENPSRQRIEEYTHNENWRKACEGHKGTNQFVKAKELGLPVPESKCKGKPNLSWLGKKHTEEQKRKISETQKRNFRESGAKSIWHTQLENRKSFAEQYFDTCFPNLKQNYHVDRYFLDLANPEKKLYIEVDGEQHYNDPKVVEHDKARTARLEELGWKCLKRIRWSEYKRLSKEEQESLITELQKQI
jgi:very-short-patch-repair endonuclease